MFKEKFNVPSSFRFPGKFNSLLFDLSFTGAETINKFCIIIICRTLPQRFMAYPPKGEWRKGDPGNADAVKIDSLIFVTYSIFLQRYLAYPSYPPL